MSRNRRSLRIGLHAITRIVAVVASLACNCDRSPAADTGIRAPEGFEVSLYADDSLAHDIFSMTIDAMAFHNRVAYHAFEGMSVDSGECERLAADLGDHKVMILRNHGLLACGETVGEAFMKMYYLERACTVQMQVLATGRAIELPSPDTCELTARQSAEFPHGKFEWPALVRLVEQRAPDYLGL